MSVCPQGVEDGAQADLGAEAFWVLGERHRRLGGGTHQHGIDEGLVLEGDLSGLRRQGEDDVEIGRGQELGLARGKPLRPRRGLTFWAVAVAAGVIGDAGQAAGVASFDVPAARAVRQAA